MGIKQTINQTEQFAQSADQVWTLSGDPATVSDWLPAVEKSWMEDDVRVAELAGGAGQAKEKITELNNEQRFYDYEYVGGPLVLKEFTSRFAVIPSGDGCRVEWTAEFVADTEDEGSELTAAVTGMYRGGLDNLQAMLSETGN